MKIAVMSDRPDLQGHVPDSFEASAALLIIESETGTLISAETGKTGEEYAAALAETFYEAVVCGPHIGRACFEPIADACITRYNGAGLAVADAAVGAERGTLPIIPDYEGGHGCGSGGECDCDHGHEE